MLASLMKIPGAVGNALDLPGSSVRDVLAWKNPFDQWATPFQDTNRTSGRDLLRKYGLAGDGNTWGNFAGGLAAEIALDPLNVTPVMAIAKIMKARNLSKGTRQAVIARNTANQANNLAADISRSRASQVVNEAIDQIPHRFPADLPANKTVNVAELPEGWKGIPTLSKQEQLLAAYGPRDDAAKVIGKYVTGGEIEPTTNLVAKTLTANAPYSTYQFHAPKVPVNSHVDASGVKGFVHNRRADLLFHNADLADHHVMGVVPHESVHSMAAQSPELYSTLKNAMGNDAINRSGQGLSSVYGYTGVPAQNAKFAEEAIATGIENAITAEARQAKAPLLKIMHNGDPYGSRIHRVSQNIAREVGAADAPVVAKSLIDYMSGASKKATAIVPAGPRTITDVAPRSFAVGAKVPSEVIKYKPVRPVPDLNYKPLKAFPGLVPLPLKETLRVVNRNRTTRSRTREE